MKPPMHSPPPMHHETRQQIEKVRDELLEAVIKSVVTTSEHTRKIYLEEVEVFKEEIKKLQSK